MSFVPMDGHQVFVLLATTSQNPSNPHSNLVMCFPFMPCSLTPRRLLFCACSSLLLWSGILWNPYAFSQDNQNNNDPLRIEDILIPDIFPDSALPEEERKIRERLRYLDSIKQLLRPEERIIQSYKDEEDVPEILEASLENGLKSIDEVIAYLRFIAFSIEDVSQTDQIINGLVKTYLSLNKPDKALEETKRIQSSYWLIRSGNDVAEHFISQNNFDKAIDVLRNNINLVRNENIEILRAPLRGKTINAQHVEDLDRLLEHTILLLADIGSTFELVQGLDMISTPETRLNTVILYIERALHNREKRKDLPKIPDIILENSIVDSFENLSKITHPLHRKIPYYIKLSNLINTIQPSKQVAVSILRFARDDVIPSLPVAERDPHLISLIEPFILTDNLSDAMLSTRYISTEIDRAVGMVTLGKTLGKKDDEEFAIPLLIYAADIADATREENFKNRIIGEIIQAQSVIGRFTDAYVSSLKLDNIETRYRALTTMSQALLDRGRYNDAYRLITEKVPYINMRAPILAGVARYYAENNNLNEANRTILNSVKPPQGFPNSKQGLEAKSLRTVVETHMEIGKPENDHAIFDSIRDLVLSTNDKFLQISSLLDLAEKQIERNRFTQASRLINTAWRIIVSDKNKPYFSKAVERMIQVQLLMQDLLNAFDAAVLLPSPDPDSIGDPRYGLNNVKYRALNLVSKAAVNIGQVETAFRAANAIDNSAARTFALSVIPVYISESIKTHEERFGKPPGENEGNSPSPFLDPSYIKS
jgi:hypothetical protein